MSEKKNSGAPRVADLTTRQRLKNIPIAKPGMCPDMLRKICVDFFRLQLSFPWIPSEDFIIGNAAWLASEDPNAPDERRKLRIFAADSVCGGLPYVSVGGGTIYRAMDFYNEETGVLDVSSFHEEPKFFGNACSGSAAIAWSRVITSADLRYTYLMNQNHGFLRVGPYTYNDERDIFTPAKTYLKNGNKGYTVKEVCKENGPQVMFESYAKLQPADGIASIGHVRMISDYPVVTRNMDGTINGEESFVTYMDQCKPRKVTTQCDGTEIIVQGGVDVKISFKQLFDTCHSAFTFAEFQGTAPVQEGKITFDHAKSSLSLETLKELKVSANFCISDVYLQVEKTDGTVLHADAIRPTAFCHKTIELKKFHFKGALSEAEKEGKLRIRLSCQLMNGERKEFYYGILSAEDKEFALAADPFTPAKLDEIPVARPDMTEEELRQICLDYMKLQTTFSWTPKEDYEYVIERWNRNVELKKDKVYGGFPYVTKGSGNLYRAAEWIDPETGVMDMTEAKENPRYFGNACSGAACSAWSRVVSSVSRFGYTRHMTQKNGFLRVGPYTYSDDLEEFIKPEIDKEMGDQKEYSAANVCAENGLELMYESYAQLKPGDGIVSKDHVRMITSYPNVIRDQEGVIQGRDSSVKAMDQVGSWKMRKQVNGEDYAVQGGIDVEYSLFTLRKDGYIPFTFAEFQNPKLVQSAKVEFSVSEKNITLSQLKEASLTSNIAISDVFFLVKEKDGNERKLVIRNDDFSVREMKFNENLPEAFFTENCGLTAFCQLFNGEKITFFQGELSI